MTSEIEKPALTISEAGGALVKAKEDFFGVCRKRAFSVKSELQKVVTFEKMKN